ncbi:MAG: WD40/YVTN/BNR-like repeat-containing protein, partial [Acidobacteriaceae bacterium]
EVKRFDRRTSFSQIITPWPLGGFSQPVNERRYRDPWTPVLVFSPVDRRSLYLGTQYVMKTVDGGLHWQKISPDLTGAKPGANKAEVPTVANAEQLGYGVVYTIAPSPVDAGEIWAGSDTGRIHLTTDGGKTWRDVTPPGLSAWSKISLIDASHFDPATAYAAVDRHRLGDQKPYLYITHDYGKSWKLSVNGIAPMHFLRAVREDTKQRNLLFAGTEFGMYVSFDDGDRWQPLQLNLPVSSVRDMTVHGNDLVIATHGRSFWILDDIAPLRQAAAVNATNPYLYAPPTAIRVDNDDFLGTPLPPEEPQANNPPDGAILDYYLPARANKVSLQILDAKSNVLRHFSSAQKQTIHRPLLPIAERWFPVPQMLETTPGEHRFIWDLATGGSGTGVGGDDVDSPNVPPGPCVPPGTYTVKLSVDGTTMTRTLRVVMDPRSAATAAVLDRQFILGSSIYKQTLASRKAMAEMDSVESQLNKLDSAGENGADLQGTLRAALAKLQSIKNGSGPSVDLPQKETPQKKIGLAQANTGLAVALRVVESGDRTAPSQALVIFNRMESAADKQIEAWQHFKANDLAKVNAALRRANRPALQIAAIEEQVHYAMTR